MTREEKVAQFFEGLPNARALSPDEFFEKACELLLSSRLRIDFVSQKIEAESWNYDSRGYEEWEKFLKVYLRYMRKIADGLELNTRIYKKIIQDFYEDDKEADDSE